MQGKKILEKNYIQISTYFHVKKPNYNPTKR